ncbi:hypothetical protein [Corynebacterium timonense]|uniref:Low molecular weight antigen MTB12-like C-terminal domain-containing protein n=1 Tax=Corynebacterium timonense TaxID=441500 RepID=A0A1H1MNK9_9CORY|nr:hypothetical protein [Corynebacterium timonense]SDR88297.1 hypothetical protein SAMN04488539_0572 [Corynebacterium timonense]
MKNAKAQKLTAALAALGAAVTLAACSNDEGDDAADSTPTTSGSSSAAEAPAAQLPSAAELNAVLARATDPNLPIEERVTTVQGGETAPELFDVMAQSQQESGANFQVVDPVLPGYSPNTALATVNFTAPDQQAQLAENVEFIYEDGAWKLSQSWACTLVTNTVPAEQVPEMCRTQAPAGEAPAEGAPAGGAPAEGAPAAPQL